jgi:hypothetical protein
MELFFIVLVIALAAGAWWVLKKPASLDINKDGQVDRKDIVAAEEAIVEKAVGTAEVVKKTTKRVAAKAVVATDAAKKKIATRRTKKPTV